MLEFVTLGLPTPVALALVALIAYCLGRSRSHSSSLTSTGRSLQRARSIVLELDSITRQVRSNLATHHAGVVNFRERINEFSRSTSGVSWDEVALEAENMLKPTMRLTAQLAHAYDQLRQQTALLMSFTEVRTDPLTGMRNRRSLDETVQSLLAMTNRYGSKFSVILFDIDYFKKINDERGHLEGDHVLQRVAQTFDEVVRETDIVARYGGEEFVIVLPESDLEAGCVVAERARLRVERLTGVTVSGGVATVLAGDCLRALLSRADAALYAAKKAGRNVIFTNDDGQLKPIAPGCAAEEPIAPGSAADAEEPFTEEPASPGQEERQERLPAPAKLKIMP